MKLPTLTDQFDLARGWPLAAATGSLFPDPMSTTAGEVDRLFYFILVTAAVFFAIIVAAMGVFVWKFRQRENFEIQPSPAHNNLLEVVWTAIPSLLVGIIFFWGFVTYLDMRQAPDDSYEIQVTAKRWSWSFTYPNGHVDNDLHVPEDRPVKLLMSSDDVIHSLYIPAFRLKMDLIPGRYSTTWFEAHTPGDYTLFCAEYCGAQHSNMLARVVVHPSGEFEKWLDNAANMLATMTPVEAGEILYTRRGCAQCHSNDGSAKVGPTFLNAFGSQQMLADGSTVEIDENYLRESILEPQAKVRAGYKPVMPTYQGQLKDEEIASLIAYIKSLAKQEETTP
jgi:cytochrome c oxidase subunit 2